MQQVQWPTPAEKKLCLLTSTLALIFLKIQARAFSDESSFDKMMYTVYMLAGCLAGWHERFDARVQLRMREFHLAH